MVQIKIKLFQLKTLCNFKPAFNLFNSKLKFATLCFTFFYSKGYAQFETYPLRYSISVNPCQSITGTYLLTCSFPLNERKNLEVSGGGHFVPKSIWESSAPISPGYGLDSPNTGIGFNGFVTNVAVDVPNNKWSYLRWCAELKLLWHEKDIYDVHNESFAWLSAQKEVIGVNVQLIFNRFKSNPDFTEFYFGGGVKCWIIQGKQYGYSFDDSASFEEQYEPVYKSNSVLPIVPELNLGFRIGHRWSAKQNKD